MSLVPMPVLPGDPRTKPDAPALDRGDPINVGLVRCYPIYEGGGDAVHELVEGAHGTIDDDGGALFWRGMHDGEPMVLERNRTVPQVGASTG